MRHSKRGRLVRKARGRGAPARSSDQEVMLHLSRSQIFKDYERAFSEAVGLPLNIRAHDSWSPAHHGKTDDDSFAAILARFNQARAACLRAQSDESTNMTRARQFIEDHQAEPLSLGRIAQVANISRHYFCKMFKKATGINFTDYLSRVRVEKSKALLLNPNSRISEAAFACGFQSMTNFNREFKRIVGRSPTQFREALPKLRRSV